MNRRIYFIDKIYCILVIKINFRTYIIYGLIKIKKFAKIYLQIRFRFDLHLKI